MTKVLIVDGHPLVRDAVSSAIRGALTPTAIFEAGSAGEACQAAEHISPDIIIFDLLLPDISGLDGLIAIRSHFPNAPVLILTALDDARMAAEALAAGASGYVPKSMDRAVLLKAIARVLDGNTYVPEHVASVMHALNSADPICRDLAARVCSLTRAQIKVLQCVRRGMPNKLIAYEMGIGETTVKAHVSVIMRKLKVTSRTQVVIATSHLDFDAILRNKEICEATSKNGSDNT